MVIGILYATMVGMNVVNEVWTASQELSTEMDAFKQSSEDLWSELLKMGSNVDSDVLRRGRQAYSTFNGREYPASLAVELPPPRKQTCSMCWE